MSDQKPPVTAARKVDFEKWDELFDASEQLLCVGGALKAPHTAAELRELLEEYDRAKDRVADALAALKGNR